MKANFHSTHPEVSERELSVHAHWLASYDGDQNGVIGGRKVPEGYESFTVVDVLGSEFVWMNDAFPKEKFTWYLWFESVFLVPDEMVTFLTLRWS